MITDLAALSNFVRCLPEHKAGLSIEHNEHKGVYATVGDYAPFEGENLQFSWKDKESFNRAVSSDEIWTLQWYPDTPVGFLAIAAPSLQELLEFAEEVSKGEAT